MALLSLHDPSYKTTSGSSLHNPYRFTKTKAILLVVLGLAFLCFVGLTGCSNASSSTESSSTDNNTQPSETTSTTDANTQNSTLIAYFSATGNTEKIAEDIAAITGGSFYTIVPEQPYTKDDLNYNNEGCRANKEQADNSARPKIKGSVDNIEQYHTIYLGYPIWQGMAPRIIETFLESYNLEGTTIIPFCTSGSSDITASEDELKAISPTAHWIDGKRFETNATPDDIRAWIESLH